MKNRTGFTDAQKNMMLFLKETRIKNKRYHNCDLMSIAGS